MLKNQKKNKKITNPAQIIGIMAFFCTWCTIIVPMNLLVEGLSQICAADKTAALVIESRFDNIIKSLACYMDEIERFNPAYGLVKTDSRDTLIAKHILDSLAPLGHIARLLGGGMEERAGKKLADIGSGAGLPGIPLAVCLPDVQITLIERMGKRAGFLRNVCAVLNSAGFCPGLSSRVTVEETELEKALPGRFDLITFRALSPLTPGFVAKLVRLLNLPQEPEQNVPLHKAPLHCIPVQGGIIAAYKGRRETAEAELAALSGLSCSTELVPLGVPFLNEERCLAVIRPKPCLV